MKKTVSIAGKYHKKGKKMSDGINKEIVLHCLKSASDFHDEICEECPMYSKCDHTWKSKVYERAIELIENQ